MALPTLRVSDDIPITAQQVVALRACGFSERTIARAMGTTEQMVKVYIDKYDPGRSYCVAPNKRKAFIRDLVESRIGEALLCINEEMFENMTPNEIMQFVTQCVRMIQSLGQIKEDDKMDVKSVLEKLKGNKSNADKEGDNREADTQREAHDVGADT